MLTRCCVYFAYFLKDSPRYRTLKNWFYEGLENPKSRRKSYFDIAMILLVMLSVFLLIYEVGKELDSYAIFFEQLVVSVFICEYLLRGWLYSDCHTILLGEYEKSNYLGIKFNLYKALWLIISNKLTYVFSPIAVIDLLAILPSYRPLRILRIFLLFRLVKLFRYSRSLKVFTDILSNKRFELITLSIFVCFLTFIASTAIYMFENPKNGGQVNNLLDAIYWAGVTLSTVGYGDITPQTIGGRMVTLGLIIAGIGALSFFTSIIVTAFNENLNELRENRTYAAIEKYTHFSIICGFGRVGQEVAQQMHKDRQNFVIIDRSEQNIILANKLGYQAIQADASKNEVLENAGINNGATAILCTTGNDVTNVYVTLTSRHLNADINIISRANHSDNIKKLQQAGANHVVQPFEISGMVAAEYVGQPVAFEAILGLLHTETHVQIETITIPALSFLELKPINSYDFTASKLSLVGVICKDSKHRKHKNRYKIKGLHFYFNPQPHFLLHAGDMLVLLGHEFSIEHFKSLIEKSRLTGE